MKGFGRGLLGVAASWAILANAQGDPDRERRLPAGGVIVEEVAPGGVAEKAGLFVADRLLTWRLSGLPGNPDSMQGSLATAFDFDHVEREQGPRGEISFSGVRAGKPLSVTIPPGEWRILVRPPMPPDLLTTYLKAFSARGSPEANTARFREIALLAVKRGDGRLASWLLFRSGSLLMKARLWRDAETAFSESKRLLPGGQPDYVVKAIWYALGKSRERLNDFPGAEEAYRRAVGEPTAVNPAGLSEARSMSALGYLLAQRGDLDAAEPLLERAAHEIERRAPQSLVLATVLFELAFVPDKRGDLATAEKLYDRCLTIRSRLSPNSGDLALTWAAKANLAFFRGDLDEAERLYRQALQVQERESPNGISVARILNNLGNVAATRGDLAEAEAQYRRAFGIRRRIAPGSMDLARSLNNLGTIALDRGYLADAEEFFVASLKIKESLARDSVDVASTLENLGTVASERADYAAAEEFLTRALGIQNSISPVSLDAASSLVNLGNAALHRHDVARAEKFYLKAFSIQEKIAPGSLDTAFPLDYLGLAASTRGDHRRARQLHSRALQIREAAAPNSLEMASSLNNLGETLLSLGELEEAAELCQRGLRLRQRLSPGSSKEAESLYTLGKISRRAGRLREAIEYFGKATEVLEVQRSRLGGSEDVKSGFSAKYGDYYRDYVEVLLELDRQSDAYRILERSRARSLLSMLAERDLVFASDVPQDLERDRKRIDAEYDRVQEQIGQLSPQKDAQKIDDLMRQLQELRARQSSVAERVRRASPRLASLQYPPPLGLAGAQKTLDHGTVLLAYSVGKEKSFLFVVWPGPKAGLSVVPLKISEKELREKVQAFRNLVGKPSAVEGARTDLLTRSRFLYEILVKPAEKVIEKSDRILILPDGPLHTLPFAALVRDVKSSASQYLVEWKPVHTAVSATVYAELIKDRHPSRASPAVVVAAFGDPRYPKRPPGKPVRRAEGEEGPKETGTAEQGDEEIADPEVRAAVRGGYRLVPLPATRHEVETIAGLYAPRAAKYLGEDATEENAKALGKDTPFIHFACHGILNERFPLDSALALTIPERPKSGQDNGLLQAWEIFEKVRIDADLVTLSACETGLGKETGGEGLVGLTRAFQYAGARSILASLWKVEDQSTAELMKRLYGYLKAGKSKDQALRLAQLELIHHPAFARPSHWAAFQLVGDWK